MQNNHNGSGNETSNNNITNAFSNIVQEDEIAKIARAFQVSIGYGDPEIQNASFTSLLDLMRTPPVMNSEISEGFLKERKMADISRTQGPKKLIPVQK